jgi:hypothetical protein
MRLRETGARGDTGEYKMRARLMTAGLAASLCLMHATGEAQVFFNDFCSITAVNFQFERNQTLRTAQTFSGRGCTSSFRGDISSSFDSISVVQRARHLTITPTSNGFGFSVERKTPNYRGSDSYTLKICGKGGGGKGCVTITYDVTVN